MNEGTVTVLVLESRNRGLPRAGVMIFCNGNAKLTDNVSEMGIHIALG